MIMKSVLLCFLLGGTVLSAQPSYLERQDLRELSEQCLCCAYGFSFQEARRYQEQLARMTPDHAVPPFLDALILYWENFPLTPEKDAAVRFVELMDLSVERAATLLDAEETYTEGVFFDLFARAFKAMFWADNGRPGKVVPDLRTMYKRTMEGFDLTSEFAGFYFSTGLYNYYVEAYPEAHPVYKPLLSFMTGGNKKEGLVQLNQAIQHSVFLRVDALVFMSLIQLQYENDLNTAMLYAEKLYREFPGNIFFQGHFISILLYLGRFDLVNQILEGMQDQQDPYSEMIRNLSAAFQAEQVSGNDRFAGDQYLETIEIAESIGPFADKFHAMGLMGLSRLYAQKGLQSEANRYARKASRLTSYAFILGE
jgi:hypothetical protein